MTASTDDRATGSIKNITESSLDMGNKILAAIGLVSLVIGASATVWMFTGGRGFFDTHIRQGTDEQVQIVDSVENHNTGLENPSPTASSYSSPPHSLVGTWAVHPELCNDGDTSTTYSADGTFMGGLAGRWSYEDPYLVEAWDGDAGSGSHDGYEAGIHRFRIVWRSPDHFDMVNDNGAILQPMYRCP